MTFKKISAIALSAAILVGGATAAKAAGFYIQEQSIKGLGSAFAGSVTSIEDASTIYFNPAGMTKLDGMQINTGVNLLIPRSDLEDTGSTLLAAPIGGNNGGNPYEPTPVPNFYAAYPLESDIWLGFGVSAPFGLANDYHDGWFGRYDSTETKLTTIDVSPTVAWKAAEWLSIGGGLNFQYADAELKSAVFAGTEGTSKLTGKDLTMGYNVGFQLKPLEDTEIGVHYRSSIHHDLDGRIQVSGSGGADFNIKGGAELNLPDIATFGIAQNFMDKWRVMGQATWFGWNNFQEIRAKSDAGATISNTTQNYQATWAFAVGLEYDWKEDWTLRAGYQHDSTPTTDEYRTSRTPDGDRNWFSVGATHTLAPNLDLDLAATYINIADETIGVTRNGGAAVVNANTDGSVGIVALGLTYKF